MYFGKAKQVELRDNPLLDQDYGDPQYLKDEEALEKKRNTLKKQEALPSRQVNENSVTVEDSDEDELQPNDVKKDKFGLIKKLLKFPFFTPTLIVIQTGLFIAMIIVSVQRGEFGEFWKNPLIGPGENVLIMFGARRSDLILNDGGVWRLLVSMFLHSGVFHYLMNVLFELQVLLKLERTWGFIPVTAIWLCAGLGGNLLSTIFLPNVVVIGSTTTLAGITASMLAEVIINWSYTRQKWKRLATVVFQCCFFIALGFLPFIDNFANIGGFISGLLISFVLIPRGEQVPSKFQKFWCWTVIINRIVCAVILACLILSGFLVLYLAPQAAASCYPNGWCYYFHPDWDFFFGAEADI